MNRTLNHLGLWGLLHIMISVLAFALPIQLYDTDGAAIGGRTPAGNSFHYAADIRERTFADEATIRTQVGFSKLNDNISDQAQLTPYSDVHQALHNDIKSTFDIIDYDLSKLLHISIPLPDTFWLFLFAPITFLLFTYPNKRGLYEPGITFRAV